VWKLMVAQCLLPSQAVLQTLQFCFMYILRSYFWCRVMAVPVLAYVFPVYVLRVLWCKDTLFLLLNIVVCRHVLRQVKLYI